jgi:hypothetical protein
VSTTLFSFYCWNPVTSPSPLNQGLKNNKNEFFHQNWIGKILRYWSCIICAILKIQGLKCIFCETYDTSPMFDTFFISVPLLSIPLFHKKLKSIGFQLELNHWKKNCGPNWKKKSCTGPSTITCEMMNSGALHREKPMPFRVILNKYNWRHILCRVPNCHLFYLQGAKAIADLLKKSSTLRVVELNNNMIDYSVCCYLNMF